MKKSISRAEIMSHVSLLQQGLREHKLPYECTVIEAGHECSIIELSRKGEQLPSFRRLLPFSMSVLWLESVIAQLGRIPLLLAAEEEFLALAISHCKKLFHNGMVDKSAYMAVRKLSDQVFAKDDLPPCDMDRYNVIDVHELIETKKAADAVATLIASVPEPWCDTPRP